VSHPPEPYGIRRTVCSTCPFHRAGPGQRIAHSLSPERRAEIVHTMHEQGHSFVCHSEAHGLVPAGPAGPRQCTGAAVILAREGRPNQVMQVAVRLGEPPFVDPGDRVVPWATLDAWATDPDD
jgi:hypothetical protein